MSESYDNAKRAFRYATETAVRLRLLLRGFAPIAKARDLLET